MSIPGRSRLRGCLPSLVLGNLVGLWLVLVLVVRTAQADGAGRRLLGVVVVMVMVDQICFFFTSFFFTFFCFFYFYFLVFLLHARTFVALTPETAWPTTV